MDKTKIHIRPAHFPDEINNVIDIWYEASIRAHDFAGEDLWKTSKTDMSYLTSPQSHTFVAEDKGKILGFATVDNDLLAALYVDPRVQSIGVGQQLMDYLFNTHSHLTLKVYSNNFRAKSFYEKNGFKIVKEEKDPNSEELVTYMERTQP